MGAEQGLDYFLPTRIRFSQTVEVISPNTDTFWGTYQDPVTDHYAIHGVKDQGRYTKFEILDAGTMSNIPRNTRPRNPDYYDEGTQHFFLRYNESFVLRSEDLNKYVGTVGTGWQSRMTLVDEISAAETFRMIPVLEYAQPELRKQQAATNVNLDDVETNPMTKTTTMMVMASLTLKM